MEQNELNLCEILKGHEDEIFYSPLLGDVRIDISSASLFKILKATDRNCAFLLNNNGKTNENGELMLFPSKYQRDWDKWIEKHKKVTYEDIENCLTEKFWCGVENINCTSKQQLDKLIAINKLMNVQKYLEKGWQPDWNNITIDGWFLYIEHDKIRVGPSGLQCGDIYFSSKENALKAIDILGENVIKTALSTDW